jgi:HSP20 family protein
VKATPLVKRAPRSFPLLDQIGAFDGREPDVRQETYGCSADFEDAAHRYDCLMPPRKDVDRLKTEMEELFADLCQVPRLVASRRGFRPAVDVYRAEEPPSFTVVVELAGVDPDDVEVATANGVLLVRGIRRRTTQQRVVHMEVDYGPFERRVSIPDPVDAEAAEALYVHGLLVVTLPIADRPSRKLTVQITAREVS